MTRKAAPKFLVTTSKYRDYSHKCLQLTLSKRHKRRINGRSTMTKTYIGLAPVLTKISIKQNLGVLDAALGMLVRQENSGRNDLATTRQVAETATSLNYFSLKCALENVKQRPKPEKAASRILRPYPKSCSTVACAFIGLLTFAMSCNLTVTSGFSSHFKPPSRLKTHKQLYDIWEALLFR